MSVRVLAVGDPHIKNSNVMDTQILVNDILKAISEYDPDFVVVLGDTLHRHNIIDVYAQTAAVRMFEAIVQLKPLVLLIGNHDLPSHTSFLSSDHPFSALKLWNNVIVADTKCISFEIKGMTFAAVPYVPPGMLFDALSTNPNWRQSRAIFAHQEFVGCTMGRTYSKSGDKWDESLPLVISGHIHEYHRVGTNIMYVGTPRQTSFGDSGMKSISLFTFDESGEWSEQRLYTSVPYMKEINVHATKVESLAQIPIPKGSSTKIVITGKHIDNVLCKKHPLLTELKSRGVVIAFKDTVDNQPLLPPVYCDSDEQVTQSEFMNILERRIGDDEIKMRLLKSVM